MIRLLIIILGVIIIIIINKNNSKEIFKKDKLFYETNEIDKNLKEIEEYKNKIVEETKVICRDDWKEWPEKYLYNNDWKIYPFYGFNIWVEENCKRCPTIYNFLKRIKGLKLATLSKLCGKTKLNIHQGWGDHSNYVIRCHYGIIVPERCYIYVEDEKGYEYRFHKEFEWLIFDDSKFHYAENQNDSDRIVLIVDIERPNDIKIGVSEIGDTKELIEIFFKEKKIKGELHQDPWVDFGYNRSLALNKAYNKSDYLFIFDADDKMVGNIIFPKNI
jgi:beta-hydroxylase